MEVKDYHVGRSCLGWEGALRIGSMEVMEGGVRNLGFGREYTRLRHQSSLRTILSTHTKWDVQEA